MNRKAFTLVEIMIVVGIVLLLAAIAIPNLLRARITAQESVAAVAMHTVAAAEIQWRISNPTYTSLAQLGNATPPYIDAILASGTKQGYTFVTPFVAANAFVACAIHSTSQAHSSYIDEAGVICQSIAFGQECPVHMGGICIDPWIGLHAD